MKSSQNVRTSRGKNRLIFKNTCRNRLKSTAVKRALTSSILPRVNTCCTYSSRSAVLARSKEALSLRNQNNFLSGKIFIGYALSILNSLSSSLSSRPHHPLPVDQCGRFFINRTQKRLKGVLKCFNPVAQKVLAN